MHFIDVLIVIALAVVVATLCMGFYSLYRGGDYALKNSNKFMRYRVMAQAAAIVLLAIGLLIKAKGSG
ncbi:MAG TPA: twin transmembrane helix small protein [Caulobacteraceae bacterium]|jgi:hypothetical protein|nr:twin transmembrane helix small protein [Caulobacteraceae bacterium]